MFIGLNNAITGLTQDQLSKTINSLFSKDEQGTWYDPSDLSTLYQDDAGTTPVTAVEQPVGRMLDKSGRGNHATQATTASRPVLSARYNLASVSTGSALLTTTRTTYVDDGTKFLDGTPFYKLKEDTTAASSHFGVPAAVTLKAGVSYTAVYYVKAAGRTRIRLDVQVTGGWSPATPIVIYDLVAKTATPISGAPTGTITDLGDGIFRLTFTATIGASDISTGVYPVLLNDAGVNSYTGDGGSGMYITGYDIKPTNQADLPYQRVTTSTNYDTVGFRPYLKFDGVDDFLQTNSINFTATDKMTVVAGVRKLSDGSTNVVAELSSNAVNNNQCFTFLAPSLSGSYRFFSKGTLIQGAGTGNFAPAPNTSVITGIGNISGDVVSIRRNGALLETNSTDQGDGNYGNYPLYIGRRGGTSLPFNGHLYSLIIRGAQSSEAQILSAETYCNQKTGAY